MIAEFNTGDAFVVKLSPTGARVYSTYLGGTVDDVGIGIAVDSQGSAYVVGSTLSPDFPVVNSFQKTYGGAAAKQTTRAAMGSSPNLILRAPLWSIQAILAVPWMIAPRAWGSTQLGMPT